jgi:hypothetical protein
MTSIPLHINYIILLGVAAASGWLILIIYWRRIKRYAPEASAIAECRRKQLPLVELIDGNHLSFEVERPVKKGSIVTKIQDYGLGVDPKILGSDPALVAKGGLRVYHRSPAYVTDMPPNHVRANIAIIEYARTHTDANGNEAYAELGVLSDEDIIALCGTDRGNLEHNCQAYIDKKDSKLTLERLVILIMNLQDEIVTLPIKSGYFSYLQGIRLNPSRFTPQNFEAILNIMKAEAAESYKGRFDDYVKIGAGGFLLMIGAAFAVQKMGIM